MKLFFGDFSWLDLIDILIVTLIFYQIFKLFRGTKSLPVFIGILLILILWATTNLLRLKALSVVFATAIPFLGLAAIVVFQQELRRFLTNIGQAPLLRLFARKKEIDIQTPVIDAVRELSRRRWGAIIVIQRTADLSSLISVQSPLNADLDSSLIVSIFSPYSPLHDGALIVKGDKIISASALLPLTDKTDLPFELGTRHRAGIGITEETDAIAIIISEERGSISVAFNGYIYLNISYHELPAVMKNLTSGIIPKDKMVY